MGEATSTKRSPQEPTAPWSVKGIDPRAREAAREAARRRGMTIGEWLNQAILANDAALAAIRREPDDAPVAAAADTAPEDAALVEALAMLSERVDRNDQRAALHIGNVDRSLAAIGQRLEVAEQAMRERGAPGDPGAGAAVEAMITELREAQGALLTQMRRLETEDVAALRRAEIVRKEQLSGVEESVSALAARAARTEADTGAALQSLESAIATLDEKMARADAASEGMVSARFAALAEDISAQVDHTRAELAQEVAAALGELKPEELRAALSDLSKRVTATERRHAQTIEAVSIEIKRLNESMERRLRSIEQRNDDGAAAREEVAEIARSIEQRFAAGDQRDAALLARIEDDISVIADRLDHRVAAAEERNSQAIEQVSEQVGVIAERLHERQERFASEVAEHIVRSEERQGVRLADALSNLSATLNEIEGRAAAIADPMQHAMSSMTARLSAIEARVTGAAPPPAAPAQPVVPPPDPAQLAHHHQALREVAEELAANAPLAADAALHEDAIFVEDIEARYAQRDALAFDEMRLTAPGPEETGEEAPEETPAAETASDPFADLMADGADEDEDLFWATEKAPAGAEPLGDVAESRDYAEPYGAEHDPLEDAQARGEEPLGGPLFDDPIEAEDDYARAVERASLETLNPAPGPAGDYLAAARRAAQATPAGKQDHAGDGPKLRGAVRVVAWGAALAAALAGGAIYYQMAGEKRAASREGHAATPRPSLHNPSAALVNPPPGSIAEAAQETEPHADAPAAPPASAAAPPAAESAPKPARAGPLHPTAAPAPAASSVTLEQAAAKGDALAQYDLALARYAAGDRAEGARLLRLSAAQNLAVAQYRLGKAYERGEGLTPNAVEARRWVERAAKSGNVKAMHDLGVYLARGEGAPLDEPAAFRWFLDAAEHGVVDSQFNLGVLYLQGRGADADSREAFYWFAVAAAGGDGDARSRATALEKQLGADAVATLRARARAFHAKPEIAQANGALGARPWASEALQAQATTPPRT